MNAKGYPCAPAVMQYEYDSGVSDRDDGSHQHEPAKSMRGPMGYENGGKQARGDVTNTLRGEIPA